MNRVIITCEETYGFGIPKIKILDGDESIPYLNLTVGDSLMAEVGHFDYNTATFQVELIIVKRNDNIDGSGSIGYCVEVTKDSARKAFDL